MARVEDHEFEEAHWGHDADPDALSAAPGRVASIVGAAERAAAELREQAEARARERIAEAERAAEIRVRAADEEADETLADAREQAEAITGEATHTVAALEGEAQRARDEALQHRVQAAERACGPWLTAQGGYPVPIVEHGAGHGKGLRHLEAERGCHYSDKRR